MYAYPCFLDNAKTYKGKKANSWHLKIGTDHLRETTSTEKYQDRWQQAMEKTYSGETTPDSTEKSTLYGGRSYVFRGGPTIVCWYSF